MIYTEATKKAMRIAFEAHRGQLDRAGIDYVNHPLHLAEQMETEDETCAALLHDVVEDSDWTLEQLREEGIPEAAVEAVALLTHDERVPYLDYVAATRENPIAVKVKLADLAHNSDFGRLADVTEADRERLRRYEAARNLLLT
ncbi:HD domain-containing protein [Xiamenia xianingshaonis]|uniref:GTP pyrophosphokinase n=1 Tax=Xiamenia xianingshaonis TaxID=2682776 RepID=A0A9E6MQV0_9ACTN|nr:HD domain-containing protein [Xiamenia xianingshaonis]NHM13323.1 HD domain-containing protein [Xiamenia xianingshaonis]QTU84596.1 GTP pyrophosphokinase [Xiamenia xianingshaonis]